MTTVHSSRRHVRALAAAGLAALVAVPLATSSGSAGAAARTLTFSLAGSMTIDSTDPGEPPTEILFPEGAKWSASIDEDAGTIRNGRVDVPEFTIDSDLGPLKVLLQDESDTEGSIDDNGEIDMTAEYRVILPDLGCKLGPIEVELTTRDSGAPYDGSSATLGATDFRVPGLSNAPGATCGVVDLGNELLGLPRSDGTVVTLSVTRTEKASKPGKPTGKAGRGQVQVSWTKPSNLGLPKAQFQVQYRRGTGSWQNGPKVGFNTVTAAVTGLTNGVAYSFRVGAVNTAGTTWSDTSANVTPRTVPGKPTSVKATAGKRTAVVSWKAPSSNGGATITKYAVTSQPGGKTCSPTGKKLTCTVKGLTAGKSYKFAVKASNAAGAGAAAVSSSVKVR